MNNEDNVDNDDDSEQGSVEQLRGEDDREGALCVLAAVQLIR